jgi:DNA invertase Pin-like site-specific DNA recombinase
MKTAIAVALFLSQKSYRHLRSFHSGHLQNLGVLQRRAIVSLSWAFVFAKVRRKRVSFCQEFCEATGGLAMKIGYARVSTLDQHLDLQLRALKKAGCTKIWREKVSGLSRQRPELQRLLDQLRPGDTVVVWKLDRIARSTRHLLEIMDTIREAGVRFRSLSEPWADTTTHAGKMIMTVFAGIAEFERDLIQERTAAGRIAAQKRGVLFGRPRKLNADQEKLARRLVSEGKGVLEIAHTFNVHPSTIYRLSALDA